MKWLFDMAVDREARTLAEEWWNGARWEDLTDRQRKAAMMEAEAIRADR